MLARIAIPRSTQAAVPAECSDGPRIVAKASDDRHSEAETVGVEVIAVRAPGHLLLRKELVGGHQYDGRTREDSRAAPLAVAEHHLTEGEEVASRGHESRRT